MNVEILTENHDTQEAADKRMAELKKKSPSATMTVIKGAKSGKYHVVRHTSGGMSMAESYKNETESFEDFLGKTLKS